MTNELTESGLWRTFWHRRRGEGAAFSLGAMARKSSVSTAFLSKVFSGQKAMPARLREPFFEILDVSSVDRARLEWAIVMESLPDEIRARTKSYAEKDILSQQYSRPKLVSNPETWTLLNHWWNIAILELCTCEDFDSDPKWISERIGISEEKTNEAIRKLILHGLMSVDEDGFLYKTDQHISFSPTRSREVIRRYHKQHLRNAIQHLEEKTDQNSFSKRNISGITIGVNRDRLDELVARVDDFLGEIAQEFTNDTADEVYHVAVQAFPLANSVSSGRPRQLRSREATA